MAEDRKVRVTETSSPACFTPLEFPLSRLASSEPVNVLQYQSNQYSGEDSLPGDDSLVRASVPTGIIKSVSSSPSVISFCCSAFFLIRNLSATSSSGKRRSSNPSRIFPSPRPHLRRFRRSECPVLRRRTALRKTNPIYHRSSVHCGQGLLPRAFPSPLAEFRRSFSNTLHTIRPGHDHTFVECSQHSLQFWLQSFPSPPPLAPRQVLPRPHQAEYFPSFCG